MTAIETTKANLESNSKEVAKLQEDAANKQERHDSHRKEFATMRADLEKQVNCTLGQHCLQPLRQMHAIQSGQTALKMSALQKRKASLLRTSWKAQACIFELETDTDAIDKDIACLQNEVQRVTALRFLSSFCSYSRLLSAETRASSNLVIQSGNTSL